MPMELQTGYQLEPLVPAETVESRVYQRLRQAIVEGVLAPGERLVLTRLASDLSVSRVPVTQALKRLETEGFVRANDRGDVTVVMFSAEDVWEIYTLRATLQPLAARMAAERGTPEQIERIRCIVLEVAEAMQTGHAINDRHLHEAVADAANMPRLNHILMNLWDHTEVYRAALDASYRQLEQEQKRLDQAMYSMRDHDELLQALLQRDGEAAAVAERRHALRSMERVLALPAISSKTTP